MKRVLFVLLGVFQMSAAMAADEPERGFFKKTLTPVELLGEQGANAISSVFAPDENLIWQLSVPDSYDPSKPAGAIVFVNWGDWGAGRKTWAPVLADRNLIWIGLIDGGDKKPINQRMLKAILARAVLEREYKIDPERYYLFGYSGGAHVAAMLATSKPEMFKGAIFHAEALGWGKKEPPKIDLVRQNRYVFLAGSKDDDRRKIEKVARSYEKAGAETLFISVANEDRSMLHVSYVEEALAFIDSEQTSSEEAAN